MCIFSFQFNKYIHLFWIFIFASQAVIVHAQDEKKLTIYKAYQLARANYPAVKQKKLIEKTAAYSLQNAAKGYLPQVSIGGQATYQSDVTSLKISVPGFSVSQISKDQYKISGEIDQIVYDGGIIKNQQQTVTANTLVQQQNVEVELYALYDRINQLFFGILLADEQLKQNELLKKDIQNGIDKTNALIANGTAFKSSADELKAQLLQADQNRIEIDALKKSYTDMLALFLNMSTENIVLQSPSSIDNTDSVNRPETILYDYQKKLYDLQWNAFRTQLKPKLNFFFQGGYARPALNLLSNNFAWYYLGGLKLNWNFGGLYTQKNQKQIFEINKQSIDIEKETFLFNTRLTQKQAAESIIKYKALIEKDDAIIALRQSVKNAAGAQLQNGVLSAHDYLNQVNAEDEARQNRILHQLQFLQTQYTYQTVSGFKNE